MALARDRLQEIPSCEQVGGGGTRRPARWRGRLGPVLGLTAGLRGAREMHRCQEAAPSEQAVENRATWWFRAKRGTGTRSTPARRTAARARLTQAFPSRSSSSSVRHAELPQCHACARGTWRAEREAPRRGALSAARARLTGVPVAIAELVLPRAWRAASEAGCLWPPSPSAPRAVHAPLPDWRGTATVRARTGGLGGLQVNSRGAKPNIRG